MSAITFFTYSKRVSVITTFLSTVGAGETERINSLFQKQANSNHASKNIH